VLPLRYLLSCRRLRLSLQCSFVLVLMTGCAGSPDGFDKSIYAAGGVGASRLTPITDNTEYLLDQSVDSSIWVSLGMDLSERLSAEFHYAELGDAVIQSTATQVSVPINYSAMGLSAIYYALGNYDALSQRGGGFAGYLRLGVSDMTHEAGIALDIDDSPQLWAGLGAEYMFASRWAGRFEVSNYDGDAQALNLGIVYRFGRQSSAVDRTPPITKPTARPPVVEDRPATETPETAPQPEVTAPTVPATPAPEPSPTVEPAVPPVDILVDDNLTPSPAPSAGIVAGIQKDLVFLDGTPQLTASGLLSVQQLAEQLKASPSTRVEIQTHADNRGGAQAAMQLARQRVLTIAKALIRSGVAKSQLGARAFGALQPLSGTDSDVGRQLDNRVELIILSR